MPTSTGNKKLARQLEFSPTELSLLAVALDAERTSASLNVNGHSLLALELDLTRVAATRVDVAIDSSPDGGTTWMPRQSKTIAAGLATLDDAIDQKTVAADDEWSIEYENLNFELLRIRVSSVAGGVTDLIDVWARLSTG